MDDNKMLEELLEKEAAGEESENCDEQNIGNIGADQQQENCEWPKCGLRSDKPPRHKKARTEWRSADIEEMPSASDAQVFPLGREDAALVPVHSRYFNVGDFAALDGLFHGGVELQR